MFKRFFYLTSIFSVLIATIFQYSTPISSLYFYPIKNNQNISSYFGYRYLFNKRQLHNGLDIPAVPKTKIYSIDDGTIYYQGFDRNGYGNCIVVLHYNGYKSLYGHLLEDFIVSTGDKVKKGDVIAYVGNKYLKNGMLNGSTTGPHLHFTVFSNDGTLIDPISLEYVKEE